MVKPLTSAEYAPAPAGTRVRIVTWVTIGAIAVVILIECGVFFRTDLPRWLPVLIAATLGPVLCAFWWGSRIHRYHIADGELRVVRAFHSPRFPLTGLREIVRDPQALRGAWKIYGNDGFGAIAGRYYSKRLGKFRAYVTDGERALVLRWPETALVISPAQTDAFVAAVQAHRDRVHFSVERNA